MVLTEDDSDESSVPKIKGKIPLSFMKKKEKDSNEKSLDYDGNVTATDYDLRNSELVFDKHR